jgi:hypothetical protein
MLGQVNSDPWRPGTRGGLEERDPDTRSRACRGQHRGRCDPPRHLASTWKRPTRACAPHDTGPSRCPSMPMSSSTATASCCSTPTPAIRSPPGWRPSATTSPMCELRCCPISTRTTSAGCRSSNAARGHGSRARPLRDPAPTGVPVAAGRTACATTGERPAPPRASGRLHRVAPGSYPPSACGRGPSAWSAPPTTGAGAATGAPLAGGVSRCRCSSRMCQSRSLLVPDSRPQVTHFTGIGGSLAAPGASPVARRPVGGGRTGSRIDQLGAWRQGGLSALRLAQPSGCAPRGIRTPNPQIRTIAVVAWDAYGECCSRRSEWVRRPTTGLPEDCHHRAS